MSTVAAHFWDVLGRLLGPVGQAPGADHGLGILQPDRPKAPIPWHNHHVRLT